METLIKNEMKYSSKGQSTQVVTDKVEQKQPQSQVVETGSSKQPVPLAAEQNKQQQQGSQLDKPKVSNQQQPASTAGQRQPPVISLIINYTFTGQNEDDFPKKY
jgi:hypothetical protein